MKDANNSEVRFNIIQGSIDMYPYIQLIDMHVVLGRQMSIGHFICPLDISNVHWIQWTIGQYPLLITNISMMLFPGSYKVRFSPLDSIDSQISNGHIDIQWTFDMSIGSIGHAHVQWTFELSTGSNGHSYVQWTFHIYFGHCVSILNVYTSYI